MLDPTSFYQVPALLNLQLDIRESETARKSNGVDVNYAAVQLRIYLHGRDRWDEHRRWLVDETKAKADDAFDESAVTKELIAQLHSENDYVICEQAELAKFVKEAVKKANSALRGLSAKPLPESSKRSRVSQAVMQLLS